MSENTDFKLIELRERKNKKINGYTKVSIEDFDRTNIYFWSRNKKTGYIKGIVDKKTISLSHFIFGKPKKGFVIDHKNNERDDNCRYNLHEITYEQNAQNKKKTKKITSSNYIGIRKKNNKWEVNSGRVYLGRYDNEDIAASKYDEYVLVKYGEFASTNGLIEYEDILHLTFDDVIPKKNERDLPKNICLTKYDKLLVTIQYNKTKYQKECDTLDDAINQLKIFKDIIIKIKENEKKNHYLKKITKNNDGDAIIPNFNDKKEIINYTIVDADKWHDLSWYKWSKIGDYISNKKLGSIHRYLMSAPDEFYVDHIDNNPNNNKLSNLRFATYKQNGYNTKKNIYCSTIYKGVSQRTGDDGFIVSIQKDSISYYLGYYTNILIAALAYNIKAEELFKEFANLNLLEIDDKTLVEYKNIIFSIWNKQRKEYMGIRYHESYKINKYEAVIQKGDKLYVLGSYENEIIAAIAYNMKRIEFDGAKAKINKINIDDALYEEYKEIVLINWKKKADKIYNGVTLRKDTGKYRSRIIKNNKTYSIGNYDSQIKAAIAYNLKSIELNGENTKQLNDIDLDEITHNEIKNEILNKWNKTKKK
jgi:hypothetical protein